MRAPLCGENLVRIAFLDEAGRSRHEPIIVVGGILVHGDRTYRKLVARFDEIAAAFLPEADRNGFVFHAKDIFHGSGHYFKDRDTWPRSRRWPILSALASLPREFGIPVVFGHLDKAEYRQDADEALTANSTPVDRANVTDIAEHINAFARAEIGIEGRRRQFSRDEICMLIAEDTDRVKRAVKQAHALLRDPNLIANSEFAGIPNLPLVKIEDTPHFATRPIRVLFSLPTLARSLITRRLLRQENSQQFFELIAPQLSWSASDFGERMGESRSGRDHFIERAIQRFRAFIGLDLAGHVNEPLELLGVVGFRFGFGFAEHELEYSTMTDQFDPSLPLWTEDSLRAAAEFAAEMRAKRFCLRPERQPILARFWKWAREGKFFGRAPVSVPSGQNREQEP
jgi:hypothetical protein